MRSCVTSKNVKWCHLIWPTLYSVCLAAFRWTSICLLSVIWRIYSSWWQRPVVIIVSVFIYTRWRLASMNIKDSIYDISLSVYDTVSVWSWNSSRLRRKTSARLSVCLSLSNWQLKVSFTLWRQNQTKLNHHRQLGLGTTHKISSFRK